MKKNKNELVQLEMTTNDDGKTFQRKPRFATAYNWGECYSIYNTEVDKRSLTVPGQSMTVEQIYQRYASGQPVSTYKQDPVFHGDFPMPDFDRMDKTERELFRLENAKYIKDLREKVEAAEKERNAAYAAEQKAAYEAKIKEDAINEHLSQIKKDA